MLHMPKKLVRCHLYFLLFMLGSLLALWTPLEKLIRFSLTHHYGSHIILIGPISAYLIYLKRSQVFSKIQTNGLTGSTLSLAAVISWFVAHGYSLLHSNYFSFEIAAIILLWISWFNLCYGSQAVRAARFPMLFLVLMIPFPDFVIDKVIFGLQAGSAAVAYWLFRVLNVPVLRERFMFLLPTLSIEVAKECSGIRSSLALLITTLLAGHFVLHSFWRKAFLVFAAVPVLILKNGVRIVTISLLTIYGDRGFLHGWLHTSGGIMFYLLGLLSLWPIIILLERGEVRTICQAEGGLCQAGADLALRPEIKIAQPAGSNQ